MARDLLDQTTARRLARELNTDREPWQPVAVAMTYPPGCWGGQHQGWIVGYLAGAGG